MLTARTKTGKKLCLGLNYKKETLMSYRSKEEFVCPICGESVVLKLGDQRIFHFAHKRGSTCRDSFENESYEHLEGKRQLFQWLIRQGIPAEIEYYDSEIQQRPDIMFKHNGNKYALEYQCSTVPGMVFNKRTKTYLENGYTPLWIISSCHIHQKKKDIISLSNFQYLFLRSTSSGNLYIPAYCPEKHLFQLVESITSFSIKNAFAKYSFIPQHNIELDGLLEPYQKNQFNLSSWKAETEKFIFNWGLHPQPSQKVFLHEIYSRGLNLFLLPPEIGLPVAHALLLQTPPIIWQTYFYLDVLANKNPGDFITFQEVTIHFNKRKRKFEILIRTLPQLQQLNPILPLIEYVQTLEHLGILTRKKDSVYQLQRRIVIPRSNSESEEVKLRFYQKNSNILLKNN